MIPVTFNPLDKLVFPNTLNLNLKHENHQRSMLILKPAPPTLKILDKLVFLLLRPLLKLACPSTLSLLDKFVIPVTFNPLDKWFF